MNGPAQTPPDCPECRHTRGELENSRALVTQLDGENERLSQELEDLKAVCKPYLDGVFMAVADDKKGTNP